MKRHLLEMIVTEELKQKLFRNIQKDPKTGCWNWTRAKNELGYGRIVFKRGILYYTHRLSFVIHYGQIPKGMLVHHRCENPSCCNPEHLDAVTDSEHLFKRELTDRCYRGHPLTEDNIYRQKKGRSCKTCVLAKSRITWREKMAKLGYKRKPMSDVTLEDAIKDWEKICNHN